MALPHHSTGSIPRRPTCTERPRVLAYRRRSVYRRVVRNASLEAAVRGQLWRFPQKVAVCCARVFLRAKLAPQAPQHRSHCFTTPGRGRSAEQSRIGLCCCFALETHQPHMPGNAVRSLDNSGCFRRVALASFVTKSGEGGGSHLDKSGFKRSILL